MSDQSGDLAASSLHNPGTGHSAVGQEENLRLRPEIRGEEENGFLIVLEDRSAIPPCQMRKKSSCNLFDCREGIRFRSERNTSVDRGATLKLGFD